MFGVYPKESSAASERVMDFGTHTLGADERRLRWAIWLAVVFSLVFGVADFVSAQEGNRRDIRDIRPRQVTVSFERLVPKEIEVQTERGPRRQVVVDYAIERDSWRRLQGNQMDAWLEMQVSRRVALSFNPYNFFTLVVPLEQRTGRLEVPRWVNVNLNDPVRLCPLVAYPDEDPQTGMGYFCQSLQTMWVRSDWSVDIDVGETFRLRHQEEAFPLIHWHVIWLN